MPFIPLQSTELEIQLQFLVSEITAIPDSSVFRSLLTTLLRFIRKNHYFSLFYVLQDEGFWLRVQRYVSTCLKYSTTVMQKKINDNS